MHVVFFSFTLQLTLIVGCKNTGVFKGSGDMTWPLGPSSSNQVFLSTQGTWPFDMKEYSTIILWETSDRSFRMPMNHWTFLSYQCCQNCQFYKEEKGKRAWCFIAEILALRSLRQDCAEVSSGLGYTVQGQRGLQQERRGRRAFVTIWNKLFIDVSITAQGAEQCHSL